MNLREHILNFDDLPRYPIEVPEWDVTVWVRSMTGQERDAFEARLLAKRKNGAEGMLENMRASLVTLCTVDENGNRVFEDGDIERVGNKSGAAIDRIFEKIQHINRLSDKDVEELAGN